MTKKVIREIKKNIKIIEEKKSNVSELEKELEFESNLQQTNLSSKKIIPVLNTNLSELKIEDENESITKEDTHKIRTNINYEIPGRADVGYKTNQEKISYELQETKTIEEETSHRPIVPILNANRTIVEDSNIGILRERQNNRITSFNREDEFGNKKYEISLNETNNLNERRKRRF